MASYLDLRRADRKRLAGKEIFQIKPVILGGSPTDPANKAVLKGLASKKRTPIQAALISFS
jgi:hypothetical protein